MKLISLKELTREKAQQTEFILQIWITIKARGIIFTLALSTRLQDPFSSFAIDTMMTFQKMTTPLEHFNTDQVP